MLTSSSARLLIVDDEAPQMKALCDTLEDQGYAVTGFTSAKEALAALGRQKFDLLLTDLMMPEMNGITFLRTALEIDPHLVAIMMTAHGTINTAVEAMQAGALDYILKPFKLSAILPVLSRAFAVYQLRLENAALQQRVSERTAELEAANKELEAFSYSVSHDLRAPVRHIQGYLGFLQASAAKKLDEKENKHLATATEAAEHIGQLIEDLLRLSRLGRQPLSQKPVKVEALVQEVLGELHKEQGDRKIKVSVAELPECIGDSSLLKQVYVNLLSNAFKFTRQKENAVIEVGCAQQEGENVYFVRDNGAGFDMQYAEKLFGVFQRLHRAEEFEGTGVGLSIVQRIIQRHGGRIWAEAEVGKGATFYFTLAGPISQ